jgi:hypothetical protein
VATPRSDELRAVAQRVADALPAEEVAVTGSVSRGVADEVSDIELLVVTAAPQALEDCLAHIESAGLEDVDTWGDPATPTRRVSGYLEGVPVETIWWHRTLAEELLATPTQANADAIVHALPLRTNGLLAEWQQRLATMPEDVAAARIEEAARWWGGWTPAGLLTVARPGERLALVEWLLDAAQRAHAIVYAVNRTWQPSTKRLASRVERLPVKPDRFAERIEAALTQPDARTALRILAELQLETVQLAPSGPYVERARRWLTEALELLR